MGFQFNFVEKCSVCLDRAGDLVSGKRNCPSKYGSADNSSGSADQAANAINVHCSFLKMSLEQIFCGEKGSKHGERGP